MKQQQQFVATAALIVVAIITFLSGIILSRSSME